jgi:hypothetical protein
MARPGNPYRQAADPLNGVRPFVHCHWSAGWEMIQAQSGAGA